MKKQDVNIEKFSVMLAICDNEQRDVLENFLKIKRLKNTMFFKGKGTAESEIADIFGFGLSDRIISATLVPESGQEKLLKELSDELGIEKDKYGLALLLDINSASSVVLDMMGIKYN